MINLEQIVAKCQEFDKKAQRLLYDEYAPLMLGICTRYAKDKQEAEDILQDGFLKIFSRIDQYNGNGSFEGWIKRIMVNTAISNYRMNLKRYYQEEIDDYHEFQHTQENNSDFTKEELLNAIRTLPKGYQIVFNLFAVEGYKHKEIAEMLDIEESTSKSQFSRARKMLQKKLNELSKEVVIA